MARRHLMHLRYLGMGGRCANVRSIQLVDWSGVERGFPAAGRVVVVNCTTPASFRASRYPCIGFSRLPCQPDLDRRWPP